MKMPTASSKFKSSLPFQHLFIAAITFNFFVACSSSDLFLPLESEGGRVGQRGLKSFKEKATGTNVTFDCSPSGPCVPCLYSEKKDVTYRCSETGYRIPLRCVKTGTAAVVDEEQENENNMQKQKQQERNLIEVGSEIYVTYRSCIPAVNQEKLSLLAFEALMLTLLMGSSFVIFRRKGSLVMPGAIRLPTNARF